MARGKKTGGKSFLPGHSIKSPGAPKIPELVKQAQYLNRQEFADLSNKYLNMDFRDLKEAASNPDLPVKEVMIASIMKWSIDFGDPGRYAFILDRLLGRLPNNGVVWHTTSPPPAQKRDLSHMTFDELVLLKKALSGESQKN